MSRLDPRPPPPSPGHLDLAWGGGPGLEPHSLGSLRCVLLLDSCRHCLLSEHGRPARA